MRISDWSSDVCSSDLSIGELGDVLLAYEGKVQPDVTTTQSQPEQDVTTTPPAAESTDPDMQAAEPEQSVMKPGIASRPPRMTQAQSNILARSEEGRVGKEGVRTFRFWG